MSLRRSEPEELFWFGIVNRGGGIQAGPFYRIDSAAGWPPVRSMRVSISSRHRPYAFTCVRTMETGRGARFFSEDERVLIGDLLRAGQSVRSIAVRLGRSPSTISREVRRNSSEAGNYRPFTAHRMALARRPRPRPRRLAHDKPLRDFVQGKLKLRWSPEPDLPRAADRVPRSAGKAPGARDHLSGPDVQGAVS